MLSSLRCRTRRPGSACASPSSASAGLARGRDRARLRPLRGGLPGRTRRRSMGWRDRGGRLSRSCPPSSWPASGSLPPSPADLKEAPPRTPLSMNPRRGRNRRRHRRRRDRHRRRVDRGPPHDDRGQRNRSRRRRDGRCRRRWWWRRRRRRRSPTRASIGCDRGRLRQLRRHVRAREPRDHPGLRASDGLRWAPLLTAAWTVWSASSG
jgi:hypothetical protein